MKLKNKQILEAQQALGKLLNTNLPVKQAYHIKKTLESIKKQIMFIDEQRKDLTSSLLLLHYFKFFIKPS